MRRLHLLALIALTAVGVLGSVSGARAAQGDPLQYRYSFDGSGIPGGIDNPESLAVNHATGTILIYQHGQINQYDSEGHPVAFAALGSPTLPVGIDPAVLAIDNSGGPTQGNIYVFSRPD